MREAIEERAQNDETQVVLLDGMDEALMGVTGMCEDLKACYSEQKCLDILMEKQDMDLEEAREFFGFNIEPLAQMPGGPIFIDTMQTF